MSLSILFGLLKFAKQPKNIEKILKKKMRNGANAVYYILWAEMGSIAAT